MKKYKIYALWAALLVCGTGLWGCAPEENPGTGEKQCEPACGENQECVEGECREKINNPCEGVVCKDTEYCSNGTCLKKSGLSCTEDSDCAEGETCQNGQCGTELVDECKEVKCNPGYICNHGKCEPGDDLNQMDTDGDTISDKWEGREEEIDTDGDTIPDYLDTDSDNDGIPDKFESGITSIGEQPRDADLDGVYDFRSLDSDSNGIPDTSEGLVLDENDQPKLDSNGDPMIKDIDGDTVIDSADEDNNGDGILDVDEIAGLPGKDTDKVDEAGNVLRGGDCNGDTIPDPMGTPDNPWDCDNDTIPDYDDVDSDGDGINNRDEGGKVDTDKDGFYDRYDLDSDNDTIPDAVERRAEPGGTPADTDGDTIYDFRDLDSDNDGIADEKEPDCSEQGFDACISIDTDSDGYGDSAEYAIAVAEGLAPADLICHADKGVQDFIEFYFELDLNGEEKSDYLNFIPKVSKLDLVFNVDTTSSMSGSISNIKSSIDKIISGVRNQVADSAIGLSRFDDFPIDGYGYSKNGDLPWQNLGNVTLSDNAIRGYMNHAEFKTHGAGDVPESGFESLYQIAKNAGGQFMTQTPLIDGDHWGGMNFRKTTLPIVIHITDAPSHNKTYSPYSGKVSNPHYESDTLSALKSTGIRVITVDASGSGTAESGDKQKMDGFAKDVGQLTRIAASTNAMVPLCGLATKNSSGLDACATGIGGASDPNTKTSAGKCVLRFQTKADGTGLGDTVVKAVDALVKYSTFNVAARVRGVPLPGSDKTTACFLQKVEAWEFIPPPNTPESICTPKAEPAKFKASDYYDGFKNFATGKSSAEVQGSSLKYKITAKNQDCVQPTNVAQLFEAYIDVYDADTEMVFDTQRVSIIVPGVVENNDIN